MPTFWHSPWEISHGECQFLGITWETDTPRARGTAGAAGPGSVAELRATADHVLLQLGADGVVERRRDVLLELLLVDDRRPGVGVEAPGAHPLLVVVGGGEH